MSHYYAQNFSPDHSFFTGNKVQLLDMLTWIWMIKVFFLILEYKWVSDSQSPHMAMSVSYVEVWGNRLSRIFLHRKSGIPISRMYVILFSILSHISRNFSYYYAGIILDAHESLLCSKLCQHNVDNPTWEIDYLPWSGFKLCRGNTESVTWQPCFHTLILTHLSTNENAHTVLNIL